MVGERHRLERAAGSVSPPGDRTGVVVERGGVAAVDEAFYLEGETSKRLHTVAVGRTLRSRRQCELCLCVRERARASG